MGVGAASWTSFGLGFPGPGAIHLLLAISLWPWAGLQLQGPGGEEANLLPDPSGEGT